MKNNKKDSITKRNNIAILSLSPAPQKNNGITKPTNQLLFLEFLKSA